MLEGLIPQTVLCDLQETDKIMRQIAEQTRPYLEQVEKMKRETERVLAPIAEAMRPFEMFAQQVAKEKKNADDMIASMLSPYASSPAPRIVESQIPIQSVCTTVLRKAKESTVATHTPKVQARQKDNLKIIRLPVDAWEQVELHFKDEHTLSVLCNGKKFGTYDYTELGFSRKNTRDGKFDKQWKLLCVLSVIQNQDGFNPTTENLAYNMKVKLAALQKIKESLSKKMRLVFSINSDPFCSYRSRNGYHPRFILKPESLLQGNGEVHRSAGQLFDEKTGNEDEAFNDFY